jgi:5-methyltetrahydrofolate--homocysteine methyltransferase
METKISSESKETIISPEGPTTLIGERINPTGKKKLAAALQAGDWDLVRRVACSQVEAGADILDLNVGMAGLDEVAILPQAVQSVMDVVDVPLSLDSSNPKALEAAMKVYRGKPLINSVTGEKRSLEAILPLVREYGAAVIGLTLDDEGIPNDADRRVGIAYKIVEQAEHLNIPCNDIIIDCLTLTVGSDYKAGQTTIETVRKVKEKLGVNLALGCSNISFGLPDRDLLNSIFLAIAIAAGVNCPIVDVAKMRPVVLAVDLAMGRDQYAMRYIKGYRARQQQAQST